MSLQFVLPQDLVPTVLEQLHNAPSGSHLGVSKTVEKVCRRFYCIARATTGHREMVCCM